MKHIFYAMLLCSFSAQAMEEQVEPHHFRISRVPRQNEFAHGLHVERMSSNDHRLALSPDGELLAGALISWGGDSHVKLWNSTKTNPDNKEMLSIKTKQIWDGPLPSKNKRCLFWTRENNDLLPNKLIILDIGNNSEREIAITTCNKGPFSYNGRRRFLAEHPTQQWLAIASGCQKCEKHGISLIDLRGNKESNRFNLPAPGTIEAIAYNADGSYLACLSENKCLVYQNYDLRGPIKTYDVPDPLWQREIADQAIAFDENNALHFAYARRNDGQIVSHNLDTQQISLSELQGETQAFAFNPSTRQFCTSGGGVIRTWQAERVSSAARSLMQKAKRNFFAPDPLGEPEWNELPQEERDWIKSHLGYVIQRAIRTIHAKK